MTPIFIFSLPRAGSTLLQRVLAAHKDIDTVSEPWILLPLMYSQKDKGIYAEYEHHSAVQAIEDFYSEMPGGKDDYHTELRGFVERLYSRASHKEAKYFLDKTPRYHLIVDDIIELFPDGKFIFLWRNPLSIAASMMKTFAQGKWILDVYKVDLYSGISNLTASATRHKDKVFTLQFEQFLENPTQEAQSLFDYLELPFDTNLLNNFKEIRLDGRKGDPTGKKEYAAINKDPVEKWKAMFSNPIRRAWCKRYLYWVGRERLNLMGYSLDKLLDDLSSTPLKFNLLASDIYRIIYGAIYNAADLRIAKDKFSKIPNWLNIHRHT